MPIQNRDDSVEVETQIASIFAATPDGRNSAIRSLFVETLDFDRDSGQVSLAGAPANVHLPEAAERVAVLDGVQVLYVPLNIEGTERVRKAEVDAAARLIADLLGDDLLLVFTNTSASQLHLILPKFEGARPTLRRMVVERKLPRRTAVQQVAGIYWMHRDRGLIRAALGSGFRRRASHQGLLRRVQAHIRRRDDCSCRFRRGRGKRASGPSSRPCLTV